MAYDIPNTTDIGQAFSQGLEGGSQAVNRYKLQQLKKDELAQNWKKHLEDIALRRQTEGRLASAAGDMHKLQMLRMQLANRKLDPNAQIEDIKKLYELANTYGNTGQQSNINRPPENNDLLRQKLESMGMFGQNNELPQGQGVMPMPEQEMPPEYPVSDINQPQQTNPVTNAQPNLMQMIVGAAIKKKTGYNPFETPKGQSLTGPARNAESMKLLREKYGVNSPEVHEAEEEIRYRKQMQDDLSEIRARQMNGLKPGDKPIYDNQGKMEGFESKLTAKQQDAAKNLSLFNTFGPLVNKAAYYSGPNATYKMEEDARHYKTDPAARKRIDDLLISDKAITNATVTEAARFASGKQNQTYNQYRESLKAADVPKLLHKWIKAGLVPSEANMKAGVKWLKILDMADKKAQRSIPATYKYYYDPEKQFSQEQANQSGNNEEETEDEGITELNGKRYKKINGEWHELR